MFEEMMQAFREKLPLFSGDNIFYFMQKSHYFLHLANGETPDTFAARCAERAAPPRGAEDDLEVRPGLVAVPLAFSYSDAVRTLGDPLARARPDFLTGRFVADAERVAEERLPSLERRSACSSTIRARRSSSSCATAAAASSRPSSCRRAGRVPRSPARAGASEESLERVREFAAELHRLGVLHCAADELTPAAEARRRPDRAPSSVVPPCRADTIHPGPAGHHHERPHGRIEEREEGRERRADRRPPR